MFQLTKAFIKILHQTNTSYAVLGIEETCTGDDWGEKIDSWDIVSHDLDEAECGKYKETMKCYCVAYFSLGAMLPPYRPKFMCESC